MMLQSNTKEGGERLPQISIGDQVISVGSKKRVAIVNKP